MRTLSRRGVSRDCLMVLLTIWLPACLAMRLAGQETAVQPPPTVPEISQALEEFVEQGTISGAVALVGHKYKVLHLGSVGTANIEKQRPMRNGAMFSIASMTKPIVATGVMILQDDGKLNVDDKVSKYLPSFKTMKLKSGETAQTEMTIRHLLTHTSGLGGSQTFQTSLAEEVEKLAQRPLDFEPGTRWQYSPGLNVAGRIIEIVTEMPVEDFLQQRIFGPLEMKNTTFFPTAEQQRRVAELYGPGDEPGSLKPATNFITKDVHAPNPSGGLYSTASDMAKFYRMVLNRGKFRGQQILSVDAVQQMTSVQTGDLQTGFTPGNAWGLGWCIVREPQGVTAPLHPGTFGHGGAFGTQGWVDPEAKAIYVLMIQRTGLPNSDASGMRKVLHELGAKQVAEAAEAATGS